jgi:hypothetical protein
MAPIVILVVAGLLACWIILSVLGNERQRRVQDFEAMQRAAHSAAIAAEGPTRKVPTATTPRQSAR